MWAIESGIWSPEVRNDMIKFTLSYYFGFNPEEIDRMTSRTIEKYILILSKMREKEEIDSKMNRRLYGRSL